MHKTSIIALIIGLAASPSHAASKAKSTLVDRNEGRLTSPGSEADGCESALRAAGANERLEERPSNALFSAVGHAILGDATCKDRVEAWLATAPCTQVHGVVATAAFGAESWEPSRTQRLLASKMPGDVACLHTLLPAVQGAARVDGELANAVTRATQTGDRDLANGAWMVLGTVMLTAHTQHQPDHELMKALDGRIAKELARRTDDKSDDRDVTPLLEAAGNGGCRSCSHDIHRAIDSKDVRTRRIAVAALRFSEEPGAAATACKLLRHDGEVGVREHAAWSLGWSGLDLDTRTECLRDAATHDPSKDVRNAAAQALKQFVGSEADLTGE